MVQLLACDEVIPLNGISPGGVADEFTVSVCFFQFYFNVFISACATVALEFILLQLVGCLITKLYNYKHFDISKCREAMSIVLHILKQ